MSEKNIEGKHVSWLDVKESRHVRVLSKLVRSLAAAMLVCGTAAAAECGKTDDKCWIKSGKRDVAWMACMETVASEAGAFDQAAEMQKDGRSLQSNLHSIGIKRSQTIGLRNRGLELGYVAAEKLAGRDLVLKDLMVACDAEVAKDRDAMRLVNMD